MLRKFANDNKRNTNTYAPNGKQGVLEYVRPFDRDFKNGNKKWLFRKFEKGPFVDGNHFIKALEKKGFKILGAGMFSTVLVKEGQKRVIKVIRRPDGWINYIHWAAQLGEAGHFAPKVYSYKKIKGKRKDFSVAVMERLEYTLDDAPVEHALKIMPGLLWRAEKNEMAHKFVEVLAPGLMGYVKKMAENWNIPINHFDLHDGNLMVRADGSFVIVDPVSRGEDKFMRLKAGDFGPPPVPRILCITALDTRIPIYIRYI